MKKATAPAIILFIIILFCAQDAVCQIAAVKKPGIAFGGDLIYSMPQGSFKNVYQFGVGGEVFAGIGFGSTYITGSIGVTAYKHQFTLFNTLTSVPVKIGLKRYLLLKKLFINGDVGVANVKAGGSTSGAFTAGFGAGIKLLGVELSLYQNTFKNTGAYANSGYSNSFNVKVGWNYGF